MTIKFKRSTGFTATYGSGPLIGTSVSTAGPDGAVQFNDAGVFGGDSTFTFNKTTDTLTVVNVVLGGDMTPDVDGSRNLGSPDKRWDNVYTNDLHLRNDRGDWTIVEERDYLCVINNITGKKYKMVLQPLDES